MDVREQVYSFEIARRAVGRAALHLGIDTMTEAALDVLADVLLNYLNRVGRTLSHLVESSGRTSAHVNLLDALQACQLVSSPAIQRLHLHQQDDEPLFGPASSSAGLNNSSLQSSDWKGLASFLYGPKWLEEKDPEPKEVEGAGGKQGPSATKESNASQSGWEAPYLDEVPHYPEASESCANPHNLPPHVGLSLHLSRADFEEESQELLEHEELDQIPDDTFTGTWGSLNKRKFDQAVAESTGDAIMKDASSSPPTKRVKLDDGTAAKKKQDDQTNNNSNNNIDNEAPTKSHWYIPSFYPSPPVIKKALKKTRTVVDVTPVARVEASEEGTLSVRSSLVQLGQYWGSGWDAPTLPASSNSLVVPLGRSEGGEQSTAIVPVGRASGSRVSRILEGSMDAAAVQ